MKILKFLSEANTGKKVLGLIAKGIKFTVIGRTTIEIF